MALDAFVGSCLSSWTDATCRKQVIAGILVILSYHFGWRDVTVRNLRIQDVGLVGNTVQFTERVTKDHYGSAKRAIRLLEMDLSAVPGVAAVFPPLF